MRSHKVTKKEELSKRREPCRALSLSRETEGFPESISNDEVDECLVIAAWRKILECSAQGSRTSGPSLRPAAGGSFSQGMRDYFAIFVTDSKKMHHGNSISRLIGLI